MFNKTVNPVDLDLVKEVEEMGEEIVSCDLKCNKILNCPKEGIVPRGLVLQPSDTDNKIGCIVVGINPGESSPIERDHYKKNQPIKYKIVKDYYLEKINRQEKRHPYFENTELFVKEAGFQGAILWTDLCKCESKSKKDKPALQTFRVCINRFMNKELKLAPEAPIVALGNQVVNFLALSCPDRFIVGIPHPTGGYSKFWSLFEQRKLKREYLDMILDQKDENGNKKCVRLFPPKSAGSRETKKA